VRVILGPRPGFSAGVLRALVRALSVEILWGQRGVLNEHKLGVSQHYTRPKMILSIGDGGLLSVILIDRQDPLNLKRSDIIYKKIDHYEDRTRDLGVISTTL
jgi:hypothetical protein